MNNHNLNKCVTLTETNYKSAVKLIILANQKTYILLFQIYVLLFQNIIWNIFILHEGMWNTAQEK